MTTSKRSIQKIGNENLGISLQKVVDPKVVERFMDEFHELAIDRFPRAFQWSLNQIAKDSQSGIGDAIDATFFKAVPFTRVSDDLNRTSVRYRGKRLPKSGGGRMKDVEAAVYVMPKQSAYLKFTLGERKRKPGDVGLSQDYIGIPIWHNLTEEGINPTREGNLHKNAMKTLASRRSPETMTRKDWAQNKLYGSVRTTFFGQPKKRGGGRGQLGWYSRPNRASARTGPIILSGPNKGKRRLETIKGGGGVRLLIAAYKETTHDPILVPGWNKAVTEAAERLPTLLSAELQEMLNHRGRGRERRTDASSGYTGPDFLQA